MISLENIAFSYGKKTVFEGFSMTVPSGELISVTGASGCGKSTLLNLIAGLRKPTTGTLTVDEHLPVYVFQEPRLFPWLTVKENIKAVLPKDAPDDVVNDALDLVGLTADADTLPSELSGGMRSRASLARAIAYGAVYGSTLYLLDEPFSALDENLRASLCDALKERFRESNATALLVTHDNEEAERFGDRVIKIE